MKITKISAAIISTLIAFSASAAQATNIGNLECTILGIQYGTTATEGHLLPVIDSKVYKRQCPLFEDPEYGFGGECSFNIGRLSIFVRSFNTDIEMTVEIAPILVESYDSEAATLTLQDARHNTRHTVICAIRR